jgi:hypothetical protein
MPGNMLSRSVHKAFGRHAGGSPKRMSVPCGVLETGHHSLLGYWFLGLGRASILVACGLLCGGRWASKALLFVRCPCVQVGAACAPISWGGIEKAGRKEGGRKEGRNITSRILKTRSASVSVLGSGVAGRGKLE